MQKGQQQSKGAYFFWRPFERRKSAYVFRHEVEAKLKLKYGMDRYELVIVGEQKSVLLPDFEPIFAGVAYQIREVPISDLTTYVAAGLGGLIVGMVSWFLMASGGKQRPPSASRDSDDES